MIDTNALTISVVYDNHSFDRRLKTALGFSALVEYRGHTLLFDTGGDRSALLSNMGILGIDPTRIQSLALSHHHGDHTGGLSGLLKTGVRPMIYLLPSFSARFKRKIGRKTAVTEVTPGQSLADGVFTTGEMYNRSAEQSLVIQTSRGLVVVTGCAHPGIVKIIAQAKDLFDDSVRLVMGGFHLRSKSEAEMRTILADFRRLGVEKVAPSHCTGDQSIAMFAEEYGDDFIQSGAGKIIHVDE
ncbi:MAG: MBL fold metallo-hydrolase [Chloroflexi bacterium]|nr:MBL fold metallo-hydrolase [Chloroflexota bacterium]